MIKKKLFHSIKLILSIILNKYIYLLLYHIIYMIIYYQFDNIKFLYLKIKDH